MGLCMVSMGLHRWSLQVSVGDLCGSLWVVSMDGLHGWSPWVSVGGGGDD